MENKDRLFQIFSKKLRGVLGTLDVEPEGLEEIRMRIGAPLFIIYKNREYTVTAEGTLKEPPGIWKKDDKEKCCHITREDLEETLQCAVRYSLYAYEEELKQGFITVAGGHRIGVAGRVILDKGTVKTIQPVTFLNIRLSHQVRGCADKIMPYLYDDKTGEFLHTLIISPPRCGKTTLLRDIVRQGRALQFGAQRPLSHPDQRPEALLLRMPRRGVHPARRIPGPLRSVVPSVSRNLLRGS